MAKMKGKSLDFVSQMDLIQRQFKNLDAKDPSAWPLLPKLSFVPLLPLLLLEFLGLRFSKTMRCS